MRSLALLVVASLAACTDDSFDVVAAPDAVADSARPKDSAAPATDSKTPADSADAAESDSAAQCVTAGDCRKYSSYCVTDPCVCHARRASDPDPACEGEAVSCTVDPCVAKVIDCIGGACAFR